MLVFYLAGNAIFKYNLYKFVQSFVFGLIEKHKTLFKSFWIPDMFVRIISYKGTFF